MFGRMGWLLVLVGCASDSQTGPQTPPGFDVPVGTEGLTSAEVFASDAWLSVCRGDDLGESLLTIQLIDNAQGPQAVALAERIRCINAADDCEAVLACDGITSTPCGLSRCEGNTLITCATIPKGEFEQRIDCEADPDGNNACMTQNGLPDCAVSACDGQPTRCDGDVLLNCYSGHLIANDCQKWGGRCEEDADGARCVDPPANCERCDGSVFQICNDAGRLIWRTNCALYGLQCDPERECVSRTPTCSAPDYGCVGDLARGCRWGISMWWDCAAVGGTCRQDEFRLYCD